MRSTRPKRVALARLLCVWMLISAPVGAEDAVVDFRSFSPEAMQTEPQPLLGVVYPRGRYLLAFEVSGVVAETLIKEGSQVAAGDTLVALEQRLQALQLKRLNLDWKDTTALDAKRRQLAMLDQRYQARKQLFDATGSISRDELSQLELQRLMLASEVGQLEMVEKQQAIDAQIGAGQLALRTLKAPVAGVISQIVVKPGEWAEAGDPVVELIDSELNFVRLTLRSLELVHLALGMAATVEIEGVRYDGRVSYIAPVADPASGQVEIQVEFANPDLAVRPGLSARVSFPSRP